MPIVPVVGQMWATAALPPTLFHVLTSTESNHYWSQHPAKGNDAPPNLTHEQGVRVTRHLYGGQTRSGAIAFGGDRQVALDGAGEAAPDAEGVEVNRGHAAEVVPILSGVPIERTWAGVDAVLDGWWGNDRAHTAKG